MFSLPIPAWVVIYKYINSIKDLHNLPLVEKSSRKVSLSVENIKRLAELKSYLIHVHNGFVLSCVPKEQRAIEICLAAVRLSGFALGYVPIENQTIEICLATVQQNGYNLIYIPTNKRTMKICLTAVKLDGRALSYVPEEKKTMEMCLAAVQQNAYAWIYVPENIRKQILNCKK